MIDQAPEQFGVCGSCHLAHGGASTLMWGRRLPEGDDPIMTKLCLECHREGSCGEKKTIGNYMHSLDVSVGITPELKLPLYRAEGTQDPQGKVVCSTCHNSHQWDPGDPQKRGEVGTQSDSFLRLTSSGNSPLCTECHPDKSHIQDTEHDLRACILTPKMTQVGKHKNIHLMAYSEVEGVSGFIGNFTVKVRRKASYVDTEKCTGCGTCWENCPGRRIPAVRVIRKDKQVIGRTKPAAAPAAALKVASHA